MALPGSLRLPIVRVMFSIDEETAETIRRALNEGGELAAVLELRRHFPSIADNARARECVRAIAAWAPALPKAARLRADSAGPGSGATRGRRSPVRKEP